MKWENMPSGFGWYLFTKELKNWDIAIPIRVESHDIGDRAWYEARFPGIRGTSTITSQHGYWYGPIRVERPT